MKQKLFSLQDALKVTDEHGHQKCRVLNASILVKKQFTFLPKYHIDGLVITVDGNMLDMNFDILKDEQVIGHVDQR